MVPTNDDQPEDFSYVSTLPPHSNAMSELSTNEDPIIETRKAPPLRALEAENVDPTAVVEEKEPDSEQPTKPSQSKRLPFNPFTSRQSASSVVEETEVAMQPPPTRLHTTTGFATKPPYPQTRSDASTGARSVLTERNSASQKVLKATAARGSETQSVRSKPAFVPEAVVSDTLLSYSKMIEEPMWNDSPAAVAKKKEQRKRKRAAREAKSSKQRDRPPLVIEIPDGSPLKKKNKKIKQQDQSNGGRKGCSSEAPGQRVS
jgi:hypothetical protein